MSGGPHEIPQHQQVRQAVAGWLLDGARTPATLIVIWCPVERAWGFYLDSGAGGQVMIPEGEIEPLIELLNSRPPG